MKPWIYIAGPYSGGNVKNTRTAVKLANLMMDSGYFTPIVPHLTMLWDMMTPKQYERWLEYDTEILEKCDALYRFRGPSRGADGEMLFCEAKGIPVFTHLVDLFEWRKGWHE